MLDQLLYDPIGPSTKVVKCGWQDDQTQKSGPRMSLPPDVFFTSAMGQCAVAALRVESAGIVGRGFTTATDRGIALRVDLQVGAGAGHDLGRNVFAILLGKLPGDSAISGK